MRVGSHIIRETVDELDCCMHSQVLRRGRRWAIRVVARIEPGVITRSGSRHLICCQERLFCILFFSFLLHLHVSNYSLATATTLRRMYTMLHLPCESRQSTAQISCTACMISSASLSSKPARKCGRAKRRNQSMTAPFSGVTRGWREMVSTSKPADSSN